MVKAENEDSKSKKLYVDGGNAQESANAKNVSEVIFQ